MGGGGVGVSGGLDLGDVLGEWLLGGGVLGFGLLLGEGGRRLRLEGVLVLRGGEGLISLILLEVVLLLIGEELSR